MAEQIALDTVEEHARQEERFVNRKQALDWLQAQGHKLSRGKFYNDCGRGNPPVARDGSLSKFQVLLYGQALDKKIEPSPEAYDSREFDLRRSKADAEMAEIKAEKMRREKDSSWLHADQAWATVAGLVGNLRDAIRHQLFTGQRDVVAVAAGDQDRSQEVFELLEELINKAFNETAKKTLDLKFEREDDT